MSTQDHEVVKLFQEHVYPLSNKLVEMFNEHYTHQTERRGCGYTQASRVVAEYVNCPRDPQDFQDLRIFQDYDSKILKKLLDQAASLELDLNDWHNLDQNASVQAWLSSPKNEFEQQIAQQVQMQQQLREVAQKAQLEESRLICEMIADIILPKTSQETGYMQLPTLSDKPKVGSCPMAEKFFLKIAHEQMLRQGEINIFVDAQQRPLLLEKLNMGDNHSCISLQPILMNGVRLPSGSLFSVDYDPEAVGEKIKNKHFKGYVIPYTAIEGFWFLRLTTLAISPENRKRAFSSHFQQQVQNGLYSPETTKLTQLLDVALAQIG